MGTKNRNIREKKSSIPCVEILIPEDFIARSNHNLGWTLSVYSLENQPFQTTAAARDSVVFHFMVYDWQKTIRQLLENQQIPFSVIRFFTIRTIHADAIETGLGGSPAQPKWPQEEMPWAVKESEVEDEAIVM